MAAGTGVPTLHPGGDPATAGGAPQDARPAWLDGPETLLLVEDDAGDMVLVQELLADSGVGATLSWVHSLAEAKHLLKHGGVPGCILLDLHLPDAHLLRDAAAGAQWSRGLLPPSGGPACLAAEHKTSSGDE